MSVFAGAGILKMTIHIRKRQLLLFYQNQRSLSNHCSSSTIKYHDFPPLLALCFLLFHMHGRGWGSRGVRGPSQLCSARVMSACSAALSLPPAAAQSLELHRGQECQRSSRPGKGAAAQERAKPGAACSSHHCGGQSFQQHNPAATGNLL